MSALQWFLSSCLQSSLSAAQPKLMADDDDLPDYAGLNFDHHHAADFALVHQGDEEARIFDDGRTLTNVDTEDGGPRAKTYMELQHGINGATAQQMIDDQAPPPSMFCVVCVVLTSAPSRVKVYQIWVLMNFVGVCLNRSSAAPHPRQFSTETREFIKDKPVFQVRSTTGAPPPYVYTEAKQSTGADDDMTVPE
jgi:hypothetical protein